MEKSQVVQNLKEKFQEYINPVSPDGQQPSYLAIHERNEIESKENKSQAEQVLDGLFKQNPSCDYLVTFNSKIVGTKEHDRVSQHFRKAQFKKLSRMFWGL